MPKAELHLHLDGCLRPETAMRLARARGIEAPTTWTGMFDALVAPDRPTSQEELLRAFDLSAPLRSALRAGMPAYGSCAGMILLADRITDPASGQQTLGGLDITVRRNAFGRQVDSFESDLDVSGVVGGPVRGVFIRAPWVEEVGADVEVLARVTGGRADGRIVAVRQGFVLATSFHPEVTGDVRVHALFVEMVRKRS
jgi:5'-phosphate synthase pdxT subunit